MEHDISSYIITRCDPSVFMRTVANDDPEIAGMVGLLTSVFLGGGLTMQGVGHTYLSLFILANKCSCLFSFWSTRDHCFLVWSIHEEHLGVVALLGMSEGPSSTCLPLTSSYDPPTDAPHLLSGEYRCLVLVGLCRRDLRSW